ncbi:calcium-binding EGF-like domain-containing protein pawn isoform 2-T2 [Cochliomyia hominivorax]
MRRKPQRNLNFKQNLHLINSTMNCQRQYNKKLLFEFSTSWTDTKILIVLITLIVGLFHFADCIQDISQISPKSNSHLEDVDLNPFLATSKLLLETTMPETVASSEKLTKSSSSSSENETSEHIRVERSASPILNENFPKIGPNNVQFPGETEKEAAAGRYFQYNIKPTSTFDQESENVETTHKVREGKSANMATSAASMTGPFLVNGDLRQHTSGSQYVKPTSSSTVTSTAATATLLPHNPRQNPNPDIQDIITGIVKLLNGNVNVHANTQGVRRPSASRINNRGPPRISEVQNLPIDYDGQKPGTATSIRPPPYPFDRPERPFITGVPIPEQIVPVRPGFVSNRPPWHRNKPRPPITTTIGGRRPIPQYKPLPSSQMQPPKEGEQQPSNIPDTHAIGPVEIPTINEEYHDINESPVAIENSFDTDFSNEDLNTQYIEVSDNDTDSQNSNNTGEKLNEELQPPPMPTKKEEHPVKKKNNKHKTADKKKHSTDFYTTIVETSSEVHTVMHMSSTYVPIPMDPTEDPTGIDTSTEEVIFMTASKTPELESVGTKTSTKMKTSSTSTTTTKQTSTKTKASSAISTKPLDSAEYQGTSLSSSKLNTELKHTIVPTKITSVPIPTTTTTTNTYTSTTTTTTTTTTTSTTETVPTSNNQTPNPTTPTPTPTPPQLPAQYQPRPGIVLDDPEFQPGGRPRPQRPPQSQAPRNPPVNIKPTRQHLPPGYGEIFDVTLSAIQGPGSKGGSQQTINIKPFGSYGSTGGNGAQPGADIIVSASGEDGFVSIDGKRTYINLFGDPTDPPTGVQLPSTPATAIPQLPGGSGSGTTSTKKPVSTTGSAISGSSANTPVTPVTQQNTPGSGYGVAETEIVDIHTNKPQHVKPQQQPPTTTNTGPPRPHYRPRTTQPPVRIDTCIVGDDSTCDQAQHEHCKTENGVSSCHCRPGYSRRKHREPCRRVITFYIGMRVDRIYEHRIVWDNKLADRNSEPFSQLSFESVRAIDSAMSMTPYSDEFMEAKVNNIYRGDPNLGGSGVFVNLTIKLDESVETLRPNLRSDVQKHLLGVLHRRNNNIGNSVLYVSSPEGAISPLRDLDECQMRDLNDCHPSAMCENIWGSFRCSCPDGTKDPWSDQPYRAGRECQTCPEAYCNNRGICSYNDEGNQVCSCDSNHYGGQCEIDGEVLGVAIGASVAAVIIIVLTLVCLIMWSRRWQREQKNAIGSPVFGYMNTAPLKSAALPQPGYQVTLEDRMRWAQIADVMAQTNHYGAEPIGGPTRPSSAMFAYPNLQTLGTMGMGTIGGMSMQSTMQQMHHTNTMAPPVPLPRLGLSSRSAGMRTLENSSSSEEEDRTDLLGRNFQVPRPKSRSNGSITNQSGIYYDVDYEPSANGIGSSSVDRLYGSQNPSTTHSHMGNNHIPGPQGIPMSTYTSGRAPSSYYMK